MLDEAGDVGPPTITDADKLMIKTLEARALNAKINLDTAQGQLRDYVGAMFGRMGVAPTEYMIDLEKLEFVKRG